MNEKEKTMEAKMHAAVDSVLKHFPTPVECVVMITDPGDDRIVSMAHTMRDSELDRVHTKFLEDRKKVATVFHTPILPPGRPQN